MIDEKPTGPFCQSCSMPMAKPEDFGTDNEGFNINDYCCHCFQNGKFTAPDMTLEQMIDLSADCMVKYAKMSEDQAKGIATNFIPMLKRWKK